MDPHATNGETPNAPKRWVPAWIDSVAAPVWVTTGDGVVAYVNERAANLLGRPASKCVGQPCYKLIGGQDEFGRPYCGVLCPIRTRASKDLPIEPVRLLLPKPNGESEWLKVVAITASSPDGSTVLLVHCVLDDNRYHRFEDYLQRVATRSIMEGRGTPRGHLKLTDRESQVLELLAEDLALYAIAARLHLSHATVRNHVQHILNKFGVHSIMEAVALYLLHDD